MPLLLANWKLIGLAVILAAVGGYITVLTVERNAARTKAENIQSAFDQFQAKVRVEGEAAKLRVAEEIAQSERAKNDAITVFQARLSALQHDRDRLRDELASSGGSVLPALPAGAAASNQRACFDRANLDRALQDFVGETESLIGEGDTAIALRDGWHEWYDGQVGASK
jgi:hypothetical protein